MENMLIVGGTGIVGKPLAEQARQKYNVHILAKDKGLGIVSDTNLTMVDRHDKNQLRDIVDRLTREVGKWDIVVDICGYDEKDASLLYSSIKGRASHILVLSTALVYDRSRISYELITENHPLAIESSQGEYVREKLQLEKFWRNVSLESILHPQKVTILRPYHILGEGSLLGCISPCNRDPDLVRKIMNEEEIELCDGGRMPTSLIHPKDIAEAVISLDEKRKFDDLHGCQAYNITYPCEILARHYYLEIATQLGKKLNIKPIPGEEIWKSPIGWSLTTLPHLYDSSKLMVAGFKPKIGLAECISDALKTYCNPLPPKEEILVHRNMNKQPFPERHPYFI